MSLFKSLTPAHLLILSKKSLDSLHESDAFLSASRFGGDCAADDFEYGVRFVLENPGKDLWKFESYGDDEGLEPHSHYFAGTDEELTAALESLDDTEV